VTRFQDYGRHEFKYVLPLSQRDRVLALIAEFAIPDPHARARDDGRIGYHNHSIYLDTPELLDYHERLDERKLRNRLRVRTYGFPGQRQVVFLENKRKLDNWVVKQRVPVGHADAWAAWEHDRPWIDLVREIEGRGQYAAEHFVRLVEQGRNPVSAVHYFREAYVPRDDDPDSKVRLTLDQEVVGTIRPDGRALYAAPDVELLPQDWMVMEMKYSADRPAWMRMLCREMGLRALPVPKYGLSVARGLRAKYKREVRQLMPGPILELGWCA